MGIASEIEIVVSGKTGGAEKSLSDLAAKLKELEKRGSLAKNEISGKGGNSGLSGSLQGISSLAGTVQGPLGAVSGRLSSIATAVGRAHPAIIGFTGAFAALSAVISQGIPAAKQYEKTLLVMGASTNNARRAISDAAEIASKYSVSVSAVTQEYAKLSAATKGTILEGEDTRNLFESLIITNAAMGMSIDDTAGVFKAFTQIISKGTVQTEEVTGQLGERIAGAFRKAAQAWNMSTADFSKALQNGQVAADEFVPAMAKILKDDYSAAALAATNTVAAASTRLENSFTALGVSLFDSGILKYWKTTLDYMSSGTAIIGSIVDKLSIEKDPTDLLKLNNKDLEANYAIAGRLIKEKEQDIVKKQRELADGLKRHPLWAFPALRNRIDVFKKDLLELQNAASETSRIFYEQNGKPIDPEILMGKKAVTEISSNLSTISSAYEKHFTEIRNRAEDYGASALNLENNRFDREIASERLKLAELMTLKLGKQGVENVAVEQLIIKQKKAIEDIESIHQRKLVDIKAKGAAVKGGGSGEQEFSAALTRIVEAEAKAAEIAGDADTAETLRLGVKLDAIEQYYTKKRDLLLLNGMKDSEIEAAIMRERENAAQEFMARKASREAVPDNPKEATTAAFDRSIARISEAEARAAEIAGDVDTAETLRLGLRLDAIDAFYASNLEKLIAAGMAEAEIQAAIDLERENASAAHIQKMASLQEKGFADSLIAKTKAGAFIKASEDKSRVDQYQIGMSMLSDLGKRNRAAFEAHKIAKTGELIVTGIKATGDAWESAGNPVAGAALASLTAAWYATQVQMIQSQSFGSGSSAATSPSSVSAGAGSGDSLSNGSTSQGGAPQQQAVTNVYLNGTFVDLPQFINDGIIPELSSAMNNNSVTLFDRNSAQAQLVNG